MWESQIEGAVCSNPKPKPVIAVTQRNGADVSRHARRPSTRIRAQSLQPQTRMREILDKDLICSTSCSLGFGRQLVVKLPKFWCRTRDHGS